MIRLTDRKEPETQDPFVLDYRRARTALVLHFAATVGVPCRQYPRDLWPGVCGALEIGFSLRDHHDFVKLGDFLSAAQDHSLTPWLTASQPASLTPEERDWLAGFGLPEHATDQQRREDSP